MPMRFFRLSFWNSLGESFFFLVRETSLGWNRPIGVLWAKSGGRCGGFVCFGHV